MNKITEAVIANMKDMSPRVVDKVVEAVVERELNKKAEALVRVFDLVSREEKELKKIKPDIVSYNEDGSVASSTWSKQALDNKGKLEKSIEKMKKAVDKALDTNDYSDVYNYTSKDQ